MWSSEMGQLWGIGVVACLLLATVGGQPEELVGDRCSHERSINLPKDGKCLVPVKTAYDWSTAQAACERAGGSLYMSPNGRLQSRPQLMSCLASMADTKFDDMWFNALGMWSPQFFWINMTLVNGINYCSNDEPPREDASNVAITSDYLSVDYCVSTCHDRGARFIVLHNKGKSPECYCKHELDAKYQGQCVRDDFSVVNKNKTSYFIVHAKEDNLIKLAASEAFSKTEILCATVDQTTLAKREMRSDTCFTPHFFVCCLGETAKCNSTECTGTECRFLMRDKCMLRVSLNYNWYAARAYCVNRGGDLWNMHELDEMKQVNQFLDGVSRYWIGATNYAWSFNASNAQLLQAQGNFNLLKCGHMFRERLTTPGLATWQWGDTVCDQQKSFLCEFVKTTFTREEVNNEVTCPWTIIYPPVTDEPPIIPITAGPIVSGGSNDGRFCFAAKIFPISSCHSSLCCRSDFVNLSGFSSWILGKFRKAKEHLAFIPYFADVSTGADYTLRSNMSSVSEHGSQIGLMKGGGGFQSGGGGFQSGGGGFQSGGGGFQSGGGGFQSGGGGFQSGMSAFAMSTSYGEQNGAFSTQSLDRGQKDNMARKLAESQSYLVSGNSSMDERGFAATYNTMPHKSRDYMTLQAQMDIKDDAELAAMRGSIRGKPEVTLVTDNVDMNFTVNHAVSHSLSHAGSDRSRSSLERTMEEITMPVSEGGVLRNLPERVAEARIYTTQSNI
ncbi:unnamed protein product [Lymnaea stagnalis]|uniref:C-type lectin domain-containing protein n=1 Tax=Lymnaea stagnalis TaxID=6523 RepID=A0AAV2HL16_LYMST